MLWVKSSRTLLYLSETVEIPEPPPAAPRSCLQASQFAHASDLQSNTLQAKLVWGQRAGSELPLVLPAALKKPSLGSLDLSHHLVWKIPFASIKANKMMLLKQRHFCKSERKG